MKTKWDANKQYDTGQNVELDIGQTDSPVTFI